MNEAPNNPELEREFKNSWLGIRLFFADLILISKMTYLTDIYRLVYVLSVTYGHQLRAGQSLTAFMLSRARKHGLRGAQPHIWIEYLENGFDLGYFDGTSAHSEVISHLVDENFQINPAITALLDRLLQHPID